jgi:hypothetical protein
MSIVVTIGGGGAGASCLLSHAGKRKAVARTIAVARNLRSHEGFARSLCSINRSPFFETLTVLLETKHITDFRKSLNRFLTPPGTDAGGYNSWKPLGVDGEMAGNNSHGACPSFAWYDRQQKH